MLNASDAGEELLELVDGAGRHAGTMGKLAAHRAPGTRHRAFSVFLFDAQGRMLLQRRAVSKYHSPGVWSNSCCGHPRPGETPLAAAGRRVREELGVTPRDLAEAGTALYRLTDPLSGLVEHEYNHTYVGRVLTPPRPDPAEVADVTMVSAAELRRMLAREQFSVWFRAVAEIALAGAPARLAGLGGWSAQAIVAATGEQA